MNAFTLPALLLLEAQSGAATELTFALREHFVIHTATSPEEASELLEREWIQSLFCDADLALAGFGATIQERWPDVIPIATLAAPPDGTLKGRLKRAGIEQYVLKSWPEDQWLLAAQGAVRLYQLQRERERLALELKLLQPTMHTRLHRQREQLRRSYSFDNIIRTPQSPMNGVCEFAAQIAGFDVPALILGETGTGKELLARAIHYASLRSERPFFAINCAAIADDLLESELFGHRKGAFTGACNHRVGLLEQAEGGTIFLDEIGDISPAFQVKLLRFLQEGELRPVGSNEARDVDVRVIAATNRDLFTDVQQGSFREDLYYRLAVAPIAAPALRERGRADIHAIAQALLERACARHGKRVRGFTAEALELLANYRWPGNIRELENQVTRMLMLAPGERLGAELIAPALLQAARPSEPDAAASVAHQGNLKERIEQMEARILWQTMIRHRWNKSRAADELGLSRVGLRAKLERYGIDKANVKASGELAVS